LLMVAIVAAIVFLVFFRNRSGYTLSPGAIQTDINGSVKDSDIFNLKTDLSCVPGNTPPGEDGSNESYYVTGDGTGYGICGAQQFVNKIMNYKILNDESPLGE
jgi:hypothetical protein